MLGWLSRASARASRVNRSAKPESPLGLRGQDLERDQAVQRRLAGFIDGPHAALAQQFQDLELGEELGHLRHRGGTKAGVRLGCPGSGRDRGVRIPPS